MRLTPFFVFVFLLVLPMLATAGETRKDKITVETVETEVEGFVKEAVSQYRDGTSAAEAIKGLEQKVYDLFTERATNAYDQWKAAAPERSKKRKSMFTLIKFPKENSKGLVNYHMYYNYYRLMLSMAIQEFRLGNNKFDVKKETDKAVIKKIAEGWFWSHVNNLGHH